MGDQSIIHVAFTSENVSKASRLHKIHLQCDYECSLSTDQAYFPMGKWSNNHQRCLYVAMTSVVLLGQARDQLRECLYLPLDLLVFL
jgi:hypothetical protein